MKKVFFLLTAVCLFISNFASADTFGSGANQFTIDFVTISGDSGDLGSWPAGDRYMFSGVNHGAYRIGKFEITNDHWSKFTNSLDVSVAGTPTNAYDANPDWTGTNVPTTNVSYWHSGYRRLYSANLGCGRRLGRHKSLPS